MNCSRLFVITSLFVSLSLGAMNTQQPSATKEVFSEGGRNTSLRMGRYFAQTHPEVVGWLRTMYWNHMAIPVKRLTGHTNRVKSVCWSPDGKMLASGSYDGAVCLWDVKTNTQLKEWVGKHTSVYSLAWSSDGSMIASGGSGGDTAKICIWEARSGEFLKEILVPNGGVYSVSWSPDGSQIAVGSQGVFIFDFETGKQSKVLTKTNSQVGSISWSPDGRLLASRLINGTINIWDVQEGTCIKTFVTHETNGLFCSVAWFPSGQQIVSEGGANTIGIYDYQTGTTIRKLTIPGFVAHSVSLRKDGCLIAAGTMDGLLCISDAEMGTCLKVLKSGAEQLFSVDWNAAGNQLASGADDHIVRIWDIPDINVFDAAIQHLSLKQQAFLVSLFTINQRHHRPLIIPTGTCARATFETLPACIQQLLVQGEIVQVPQPTIVQRAVQVVGSLVQNHGQGLAAAAFVAGAVLLSYLSHR